MGCSGELVVLDLKYVSSHFRRERIWKQRRLRGREPLSARRNNVGTRMDFSRWLTASRWKASPRSARTPLRRLWLAPASRRPLHSPERLPPRDSILRRKRYREFLAHSSPISPKNGISGWKPFWTMSGRRLAGASQSVGGGSARRSGEAFHRDAVNQRLKPFVCRRCFFAPRAASRPRSRRCFPDALAAEVRTHILQVEDHKFAGTTHYTIVLVSAALSRIADLISELASRPRAGMTA